MADCPVCQGKFTWTEKWRFTTGWSSRKAAPCPHCGAVLIPAKDPWRDMMIATSLLCLSVLLNFIVFFTKHVIAGGTLSIAAFLAQLVALIFIIKYSRHWRYEVMDAHPDNHNTNISDPAGPHSC